MVSRTILGVGICLAWLAPAAAQAPSTSPYPPPVQPESPDAALARELTALANNPSSIPALTSAGKSALEMGDPQAALTFFGRADELSPNNGTIKAGLGSSLVMLEEARPALDAFADAVRLGVPEGEVAADRGLAYDLIGDNGRAQRDYLLSLRRREDPEIRRRLALSQAIAGDRSAALATIEDQVRSQDRAAWRARAFILALTGDTAGATRAVAAVMPAQADAMAPFLAKLPSLPPSERALAVHFGHFPGQAQPAQAMASVSPGFESGPPAAASPRPGAAPRPAAPSSAERTRIAAVTPVPGNVRLTPGVTAAKPVTPSPSLEPPPVVTRPPIQSASLAPSRPVPAQGSSAREAAPFQIASPSAPPPTAPPSGPSVPAPKIRQFADVAAMVASLSPTLDQEIEQPPAPRPKPTPSAAKATPKSEPKNKDVAKAEPAETKSKPSPKAAEADAKAAAAKKQDAAKAREPSRVWVQLGHASTTKPLSDIYGKVKGKASKLIASKTAWVSASKVTNRLLVGPFASEKEANAFIDKLDKFDVEAISWTSPAGQEIRKLAAK
jgi:Flp pilus assembly protein TadD